MISNTGVEIFEIVELCMIPVTIYCCADIFISIKWGRYEYITVRGNEYSSWLKLRRP